MVESTGETGMQCSKCSKEIAEDSTYVVNYKRMCEDFAINTGLFPLEHTGSRRDKISERGRHLTMSSDGG